MADGVIVEVDADALLAAIARLGPAAEAAVDAAAEETAHAIVREAQGRLQRQLGPEATGATVAGIHIERADRGGFIVGASREPFPNLPLWLEKGTKKGTRNGHSGGNMKARPFFYESAELEEKPHLHRVAEAIQREIDAQGLGE